MGGSVRSPPPPGSLAQKKTRAHPAGPIHPHLTRSLCGVARGVTCGSMFSSDTNGASRGRNRQQTQWHIRAWRRCPSSFSFTSSMDCTTVLENKQNPFLSLCYEVSTAKPQVSGSRQATFLVGPAWPLSPGQRSLRELPASFFAGEAGIPVAWSETV